MKNYSYIGISFIILVFGIWSVPKIVDKFTNKELSYILDANKDLKKIPDFSFINQDNIQITNESYKGKVYVVEFFFTTCPSICPIMNRNMVKIQDEFYGNPNFGIEIFWIEFVEIDSHGYYLNIGVFTILQNFIFSGLAVYGTNC